MRKGLVFALFIIASLAAKADEGMWMLTDLREQNAAVMREMEIGRAHV